MGSKNEYVAVLTGFPKLSNTHRESVIQTLADILVADYKLNQGVSAPTVTTGKGNNRSGNAPEKGRSKDSDS